MNNKKSPPKYLIIYQCESCGRDSGYTEHEKPCCRFCHSRDHLVVVSKQKITPKVMADRLKAITDNMMSNLVSAFKELPNVDQNILGEGKDAESELLRVMDRAKKFRDQVTSLKFKEPPGE